MELLLYHWSPTERRKSITRRGLVPGSRSTDRLWTPPHVCFADSPSLAWGLSGGTARGAELKSWDLWMLCADCLEGYEALPLDGDTDRIKEYRVYHPIAVDDIWYVATRTGP